MSDQLHRRTGDRSVEPRRTDPEFPFADLSKSEASRPPPGAESVAKALVDELAGEDALYRGSDGT